MLTDLETFYFSCFPTQITTLKRARALLVLVTILISLRFLLEAVFQDEMNDLINKSMTYKGYIYEIYLVASTLFTEVFAFGVLTYVMYQRKRMEGWVKIEAGLKLETEYAKAEANILEPVKSEIRKVEITESLLDSELIGDT